MTVLFISDLHLSPARPRIAHLFCDFLHGRARHASALYILGDLFEYWIGDESVSEPALAPIVNRMRELTGSGVPVFIMHGNRDFLLGAGFSETTGCQLLPDPYLTELGGQRTLLTHGDLLCTDDVEYQRFRAQIRQPAWVKSFLAKSLPERIAIAERYRELSKAATGMKPDEIMDVNPEAVQAMARTHAVRYLIHGHTHRPGRHDFELNGTPVTRIVLGDWYERGSVLACDDHGFRLESLTLPEVASTVSSGP